MGMCDSNVILCLISMIPFLCTDSSLCHSGASFRLVFFQYLKTLLSVASKIKKKMALDTDCLILQKELASLLKDIKLFSKTVDDTDTLNILNVKRTIQKLEHLIPTIKSLLDGATTMNGNLWNDGKNCSDFVQTMLCSELALFSPQWAVWVQNEFSLMFILFFWNPLHYFFSLPAFKHLSHLYFGKY